MSDAPSPAEARRARAHALARDGAEILDPDRTWIDPEAVVEPGARIWPDVYLVGRTRVASGAEIRPGCWVEDSEVGPGAVVKPHSVLEGAVVGPGCRVGPMAHLRPGSVLASGARVGNFVETKNARVGEGAKASHLTYLGDVDVGPEANIGAGTITCNYDGFAKHRTTIGARAFIGSNTALVAPIAIGDGAIVGAGATLTRSVPADALALARAEERVLAGHAPRVRAKHKARSES